MLRLELDPDEPPADPVDGEPPLPGEEPDREDRPTRRDGGLV